MQTAFEELEIKRLKRICVLCTGIRLDFFVPTLICEIMEGSKKLPWQRFSTPDYYRKTGENLKQTTIITRMKYHSDSLFCPFDPNLLRRMQNNCTTSDRFKRSVFQRWRLLLVVNVKKITLSANMRHCTVMKRSLDEQLFCKRQYMLILSIRICLERPFLYICTTGKSLFDQAFSESASVSRTFQVPPSFSPVYVCHVTSYLQSPGGRGEGGKN